MTLAFLFAVAYGASGIHADVRSQPNIVLLLADDLGYGELGCQGNPQIPTPQIDSIAAKGVRFTNGYVTAPFCSASRAGLMTGRYQTRFGYEFNPIGHHNEDPLAGLPPSEITLAELLQDAGYASGLIGKWHLGGSAAYHPYRHGFDEFFGFLHEGHFFVPPPYEGVTTMLRRRSLPGNEQGRWISDEGSLIFSTHMGYNEPDYDANNPIIRGGQPVDEQEYLTDALTREAVSFIRRNKERPFFLDLSYNAVHSPLQGANDYMRRFSDIDDIHRRIFAAMLANLDDSVGTILRTLEEEQLTQQTLIVFLSDNGGPTRELTSSNLPLRGEKGHMYEGGLRVPFLMQWTGTLPEGVVDDRPVISLDIYPTAAALAGAELPTTPIDGVDLMPFLTSDQQSRPHETLYWRVASKTALRHGNWKLVRNPGRGQSDAWQLYNLNDDISEANDLAEAEPQTLTSLVEKWKTMNDQMQEPFWSPSRR